MTASRLPSRIIAFVPEKLVELSPFVPIEFACKLRNFSELDHWKATEFGQFLLLQHFCL